MTKVESAREKLEESEDKYKKLIESLPHGLSIIQHNEIEFVNKATLEMFGYDDYDEIIGKPASKPLFKGEENKLYVKGAKLLNDEVQGPIHYNTLAIKKDGTIFPIEMYITKISYEGWRALQVVTIDISDQVDLEKNYRRILDSIADPINVVDNKLRYVYINEPLREWVKELGYHDDLIGKKLTEVFQFLPKKMEKEYEQVFKTGEMLVTHDYSQVGDKRIYTETRKIPIMENNRVSQVLTIVRDFTERQLYEKKLKESEEKYRHLFENSPFYILLMDENWNIMDCNKSTEDILGYSKDELIGKNIIEIPLIPVEGREILKERSKKIMSGKELNVRELRIRKKNGELVWIKSKPSLMRIKDKNYIHLIGQDITKSKEREEKLKINQFAIDYTSIEVFWINSEGKFEYVNKAACKNLGYTYNELTEMSVPDIDPDHNIPRYKETWYKMKENESFSFETRHESKNGRVYPVSVSINYLNYRGKELNIAFAIDVSEQKKAKEKLKYSEEKYRSLFENAPYSIFLIDMEGKILDCNQSSIDLFGYSKHEIIGSSHRELKIHPEEKINFFVKRFIKLIKGKDIEPIETLLYTKKRNLKWVQIRSSLIQIGGRYLIQTIIQDIEKRKKAERELKRLNKLKSDLLKRTSHELKTPLVSIKGFTNLLVELYRNELNAEILSIIDEIRNGCNRLEDLIKDIIKTSELKSGKNELVKSEANFTKLIREEVEALKGFIRLRKHTVKIDLEHSMLVYCEKEKIRDVFNNLLTNAIKYTPPNGLIVIKGKSDNKYFTISIKDTGIGLTEKEMDSIFTQFGKIERYGQGYDVISEGSGLGLYVSKKIIEMHNGRIWVESKGRNKGSSFYFTLPKMTLSKKNNI